MGGASWCGYPVLADRWRAWAVRSRQEPVPVPVMRASKVSRPAMAARSRGPVKVTVRSERADSPGR